MERAVGLHDQVIVHPHGERVPQPGEAIAVAPGIWWIRMPLPFALDHINLWLLEDVDGWTLVDTGFGVQATWDLWEMHFAGALAAKPVKNIVVTHYHPDHVGSAAWLVERTGAPFWMTAAEYLSAHAAHDDFGGFDAVSRIDEREALAVVEDPQVDVVERERQRHPDPPDAFRDGDGLSGLRNAIAVREGYYLVVKIQSPFHAGPGEWLRK